MNILCVDTSTRHNWVGLFVDREMLGCASYQDRQSCLINLVPTIATVLTNGQLELSSLDAIVTIIGPGAWSSLRIGLATVKQLCLVNQLPLMTLSHNDLLAQMALQLESSAQHILTALDAEGGRVYTALYQIEAGEKKQTSVYQWEKAETIASQIEPEIGDLLIAGNGAPLFGNSLRKGWRILPIVPQADSRYLRLLADLAEAEKPSYNHDDLILLKPLYIQPSSAEVEFKVSVT